MDFRQAVRKRPGMYFGETKTGQAANNAILELVGNAIDQFLAFRATKVSVTIDGEDITVVDDGPGMPFGAPSQSELGISKAEFDLEHPHFGATSSGHAPHIHAAGSGVGLAAVNAACDSLHVTSDDGENCWRKSYSQGLVVSKLNKHPTSGTTGTSFSIRLSQDIVGEPDLTALRATLEMQAYLYPNLQVNFNDDAFVARNGLLDLARKTGTADAKAGPCFYYDDTFEDIRIQAALVGIADETAIQRGWVNGQESRYGGSHMTGLERALGHFNWRPAISLINVIMHNPKFAGPTKDILLARDVCEKVETALRTAITRSDLQLP